LQSVRIRGAFIRAKKVIILPLLTLALGCRDSISFFYTNPNLNFMAGNTMWDEARGEHHVGRKPVAIRELMDCADCKMANLMESEAISLRLYTGPAV